MPREGGKIKTYMFVIVCLQHETSQTYPMITEPILEGQKKDKILWNTLGTANMKNTLSAHLTTSFMIPLVYFQYL